MWRHGEWDYQSSMEIVLIASIHRFGACLRESSWFHSVYIDVATKGKVFHCQFCSVCKSALAQCFKMLDLAK